MLRLQAACTDIPALTTATKDLHDRITALVIDAQVSMQQQQQQQQQSATMPLQGGGNRPGTAAVSWGLKGLGCQ